jgi:hypothetical protein
VPLVRLEPLVLLVPLKSRQRVALRVLRQSKASAELWASSSQSTLREHPPRECPASPRLPRRVDPRHGPKAMPLPRPKSAATVVQSDIVRPIRLLALRACWPCVSCGCDADRIEASAPRIDARQTLVQEFRMPAPGHCGHKLLEMPRHF